MHTNLMVYHPCTSSSYGACLFALSPPSWPDCLLRGRLIMLAGFERSMYSLIEFLLVRKATPVHVAGCLGWPAAGEGSFYQTTRLRKTLLCSGGRGSRPTITRGCSSNLRSFSRLGDQRSQCGSGSWREEGREQANDRCERLHTHNIRLSLGQTHWDRSRLRARDRSGQVE